MLIDGSQNKFRCKSTKLSNTDKIFSRKGREMSNGL